MQRWPLQELLGRLYREFASDFERRMANAGFDDITLAHGTNVLRFVPDDGIRIGALAARSGLTKQALSQQVKYLEAHGYLTVEPDPSDQRSKLVRNTQRGWDCRAVARPLFDQIEGSWARRVGSGELRQLRAALEHAASILTPLDKDLTKSEGRGILKSSP